MPQAPSRTALTFLGAADTVTGSRMRLEHDGADILVDCGLFQGLKALRLRNWDPPSVDPRTLEAVVLTHAHLDHSGYLPRMYREGYRGPVLCSPGTRDLLQVLWPDSGHLQEEQARFANRHETSRHRPALPLYTERDAEAALGLLQVVPFDEPFPIARGIEGKLSRAGHIIGAASVQVSLADQRITFSGDVGRPNDPLMRPPAPLGPTDVLIVESTYGDRRHAPVHILDRFAEILDETFARGGTVVVPAFAVGRAQHLLHLVAELRRTGRMADVPVFLDSPMAIEATRIFIENAADHRLDAAQCEAMGRGTTYANTPEASKAIDARGGAMLVISASGMATGGRVLHHLRRFLPDPRNTILLVGFQAAGTRGRSLREGADEIKIHGGYVKVEAKIESIDGLSAHADWHEMVTWLADSAITPQRVFVDHGEPAAADALRRRLVERFGWSVTIPRHGECFAL
jgi:metallo-beta-lactamase family protein